MAPGGVRAASSYDTSTVPEELQRANTQACLATDRRDPSGLTRPGVTPYRPSQPLLDDSDIVYATTGAVTRSPHHPILPTASSAFQPLQLSGGPMTGPTSPTAPTRYEFVRRGTRCGDVGWGCFTAHPGETALHGRVDGHALVGSDLTKKHQFMRLSGDPGFDKRTGRHVPVSVGSLRKPPSLQSAANSKRGL